MTKVNIDGINCEVKYNETKIGDLIYDPGTKRTCVATIADADDLNWVVQPPTKLKGSEIEKVIPSYENGVILTNNGGPNFYISYESITTLLKLFDFNTEQKRKRAWATPIVTPTFDFQAFKNFLLDYDKCTTEEMERAIELVYQFMSQPK